MVSKRTDVADLARWVRRTNELLGEPGPVFSFEFDPDVTPLVPWRDDRLVPASLRVRVDDPECAWITCFTIEMRSGQPHCVSMAVEERDGGAPITARSLRNVPLAKHVQWSMIAGSYRADRSEPGQVRYVPAQAPGDALTLTPEPVRRSWTHLTDDHLQKVADAYSRAMRDAAATGTRPAPRRAVNEHWPSASPATVAKWVGEARRRGFLPQTEQRRPKA